MVNFSAQLVSLLAVAGLISAMPTEDKALAASEAAECIRYLASLGNQACVATVSGQSFCRRGQTQITGISLLDRGRTTSSTCNDVARGAGKIMDSCTRADGTVRGANAAWGNGNLIVDIRRNP
ncbi:hypothetical protein B0I37DRAFT_358291 [Chaetomium sp. MPI-CAGE-AT-0009]|nr:hypothetical protein B0I37DRAFT_358291 [Chaetomium sp. MPI-CAGE-AT-0009]